MFGQILSTQVKWTRGALAVLSVVAFAAPAGLWRIAHTGSDGTVNAMGIMRGFEVLGPLLALLAFFSGFMAVAQPWAVDAAARHVYPLSLPIAWSRYVGLRFGAGALLLLIPTVALWLGCLLALSLVEIPDTLNAYPGTLAIRFLLGALLSYAGIFAVQYVSGRKAAHVLLAVLLVGMSLTLAAELTGNTKIAANVFFYLLKWPGPLAVFGNTWMLVDV